MPPAPAPPPRWKAIVTAQESGLLLVIALMMTGLTLFSDPIPRRNLATREVTMVNRFLNKENLVGLAKDASFIAVIAVGMVGIIILGGIDLSVGSVYALAAVVGAAFLRHNWATGPPAVTLGESAAAPVVLLALAAGALALGAGLFRAGGQSAGGASTPARAKRLTGLGLLLLGVVGALVPAGALVVALRSAPYSEPAALSGWIAVPMGLLVCCAVGALCGAANGLATVGLRVHPFIITLGGLAVYRGLAFVITKGQSITGFPESYTVGAFKAKLFGVNPVPMIIMVVVAALGAFVLRQTVFGRRTYAVGGNETAARYAGVPVDAVKVAWFVIAGVLAGLSAAMMLGYYGSASSDAGNAYELKVIAAAVVGGASLSGGRGSAIGAMLGAIVIQLIDNGIVVLGIDQNYTQIIIGLAIVIAVVVDQAKHRFAAGARAH